MPIRESSRSALTFLLFVAAVSAYARSWIVALLGVVLLGLERQRVLTPPPAAPRFA